MVTQSHRHKTPDTGLPNPSHPPVLIPPILTLGSLAPLSATLIFTLCTSSFQDCWPAHHSRPGLAVVGRTEQTRTEHRALLYYLDNPPCPRWSSPLHTVIYITAANLAHLGGETRASFPPHRNRPHPPPLGQPPCLLDARPDQHNPASYPNKINQDLTQATRETGNSGGTTAV